LSGRGLCDELITRPEESYRLCCVVVCDLETSRIGAPYMYDISHLRVNFGSWSLIFYLEFLSSSFEMELISFLVVLPYNWGKSTVKPWFAFWKKTKNFLIFPQVFFHGLLGCTKKLSSDMCHIINDKHLPFNTVLCNQFNLNLSKNNLGINSCIIGVSKALFVGFPFCHSHNIFIEKNTKLNLHILIRIKHTLNRLKFASPCIIIHIK